MRSDAARGTLTWRFQVESALCVALFAATLLTALRRDWVEIVDRKRRAGRPPRHDPRPDRAPSSRFAVIWDPLPATTIASGAVLDYSIDFMPKGVGVARTTFTVQTDAAGTHAVALNGSGIKTHPG